MEVVGAADWEVVPEAERLYCGRRESEGRKMKQGDCTHEFELGLAPPCRHGFAKFQTFPVHRLGRRKQHARLVRQRAQMARQIRAMRRDGEKLAPTEQSAMFFLARLPGESYL